MKSTEIREKFLAFFEARKHTRVSSDSLIPSGDKTVLFTSAGMNQFKDYFLGRRTDLERACSSQKCLRTGDLERVGKTASHHSFFEMLGNFSFGDYFKKEAIQWAWEFLTGTSDYSGKPCSDQKTHCMNLPKEKLWISIYEEDEEAYELWLKLGIPANRIKCFGQSDNFWPANAPKDGPNGPCGPCSEIYYDEDGKVDGTRSVEVWNLVFTQFDRQSDGSLKPLPRKHIDTGMGLERLTAVVQGVETDYETDLFAPIIESIRRWPKGKKAKKGQFIFAERAIADHARAIVFLITEGLLPSNESRGYILRMLIRRSYRLALNVYDFGLATDLTDKPTDNITFLRLKVTKTMKGSPYDKELKKRDTVVHRAWDHEMQQFSATLEAGTDQLEVLIQGLKGKQISGKEAFKLYDTYGFPLELTVDIAEEHGLTVDRKGYEKALKQQQERSRAASQFTGGIFVEDSLKIRESIDSLPGKEAQFIGYEHIQADAVIQGLWNGKEWVNQVREGQGAAIVLDHSPFYGEAGGQIGDSGSIETPNGLADVQMTTWIDDVLVHHATITRGKFKIQETARLMVDVERRIKIARSHTATHLLHWALKKIIGPEAVQAGSYVEAERIRFDFSSLKGLHDEQRHDVESLVNSRVRLGDEVRTDEMALEKAKNEGAIALFGEKYDSKVRVVSVGDYSKELCGGTHVLHTGFVGDFIIVGESSIAAGTRRLEVLVGESATSHHQQQQRLLHDAAVRLGRPDDEVVKGLEVLMDQLKRSERKRQDLQQELAKIQAKQLIAEGKRINGVTLVTSVIQRVDRQMLSALADAIRLDLNQEGLVLLTSSLSSDQVALVMAVTKDLIPKIHAGQIIKAIAPLTQGSGGGRPDFAQAGGKDPAGIPAALKRAEELIREALGK